MTRKFNKGDRVIHFGAEGVVRAQKIGGYLIDFKKSKRKFVYESDIVAAPELEDDRGKNRTFGVDS